MNAGVNDAIIISSDRIPVAKWHDLLVNIKRVAIDKGNVKTILYSHITLRIKVPYSRYDKF